MIQSNCPSGRNVKASVTVRGRNHLPLCSEIECSVPVSLLSGPPPKSEEAVSVPGMLSLSVLP